MTPSSSAALISVSNEVIAGALVEFGASGDEPEFVRAVTRPVEYDDALSLVLADVVASVGSPGRIGIVADFPSGLVGPRDGVGEQAQRLADGSGRSMRSAVTLDYGMIVAKAEIERLRSAAAGAGLEIERIELAEAAALRAANGRRGKVRGVVIPYELADSSAISSEQLTALAGMALGLASPQPGNLISDEALDHEPAGAGRGGIGWAVAAMPVPIDFSRAVETSYREFYITMTVLSVSFVALVAALLFL